ncbi:restriction endonuclease subunit S [Saccharomonospora glauca]|uniref:Restriction endonuclease S subunit n=1 Tax=Saccharomonospora glauca K62 TaxID=928724 RepID=I1D7N4_9PSEU|nr:restriction endonuclease subunit S [Saccharomonospora glauca]EIF00959.1 restriction endonuclease S subunit [Saccharomonospora glauca K62]
MTSEKPFRDLVTFARGGGWGSESPQEGHELVAIIRGTDFDAVRSGQLGGVPRRWEKGTKLPQRLLKANDIVLEISGGSSAKGQSTGRSIFIGNSILDGFEIPVIPASFCRIVRVDGDIVFPRYAYYGLQDMYKSRRAAEYENQSTGISNFQFERFLDAEYLRLPPMFEQQAIAAVLGALDDKIALNERIAGTVLDLANAAYLSCVSGAFESVLVGDVMELKYGKSLPAARRVDGDVPVFGSGGVSGRHNEPLVEGPGVIVGRKGTVGSVYWSERSFFPIDTTFYVKIKRADIPMEFAYFALSNMGLDVMNSDSAVPGLNRNNVHGLPLKLPVGESVRQFGDQVRSMFELRESVYAENQTLAQLRDTLLPKLMSGELRVRDAEKMVEDAT